MRALTPDNRLNSIRCAWDGAANNSTSRLEVNGTAVRRNLALDPGLTKISSVALWKGDNTSILLTFPGSIVEAPWSHSGVAGRCEWLKKVGAIGNAGYRIGQFSSLTPGEIYTAVQLTRFGNAGTISLTASIPALSFTPNMTVQSGDVRTTWMTFVCPDNIASDARCSVNTTASGENVWFEFSDVDIYEGPYQPGRQWFSGNTKGEELLSLSLS